MNDFNLYFQAIKRRPAAVALLFSIALAGAEAFVFRQPYVDFWRAFEWRSFEDARELFGIGLAFGALVLFVRSMLVSRFGWQCVYFGVFALALSVEYGFQGALGRFASPGDFENALYASDASDKFGAITLFFSWLIVAPLAVLRWLFRFTPAAANGAAKLFAFNLLVVFGGFALVADFYRPLPPTNAFAAYFNSLTVSALYFGQLKFTPQPRQTVAPLADAPPLADNIVLIVDESVRADHLSVNGYARQTTPTLDVLAKDGLLNNWGFAVSGATESVGSNRLLLSGAAATPDRERRISTLPTIFQYARAAGYRTFYFDGQDYAEWIGSATDRRAFGRIYSARDFPETAAYDLDQAFAAEIKGIVSGSRGNFIWVNKRGVHFRYEKNYPPERTVWQPTDGQASAAQRATNRPLENNYDNAILYNSESFFGTLFADGCPPATVFIYTSDHGQTLQPNRAPHAGDSKAEALVPLLMIGRDARLASADKNFAAAHRNIYATLLDLMNFPKDRRVADYAVSLLEAKAADSAARTFSVGNPSGAFGGKTMIFDDLE